MGWSKYLALATIAFGGSGAASAQGFVPPAGYSGDASVRPGVATPAEPGSPKLTRIPDTALARRFRLLPSYPRLAQAKLKVVGAFTIAESGKARLTAAWAPGFLPVTLAFSERRCFRFTADYIGGTLSSGRLTHAACTRTEPPPLRSEPVAPSPKLRLIGTAWSHEAWADDRSGTTLVTVRVRERFDPLFTSPMRTEAIMAMDGVDWNGGAVTLVGQLDGRLTLVVLELLY
jgi:hypothetical protein